MDVRSVSTRGGIFVSKILQSLAQKLAEPGPDQRAFRAQFLALPASAQPLAALDAAHFAASVAKSSLLRLVDVEERLAAVELAARDSGMTLIEPAAVMLGRMTELASRKRVRWDYQRKDWQVVE